MHIRCVLHDRFVSSKLKKNTALFVLVLVNVHFNGYEVKYCRVAECCTYILLLYRITCTYFESSVYENKLYIILTLKWILLSKEGEFITNALTKKTRKAILVRNIVDIVHKSNSQYLIIIYQLYPRYRFAYVLDLCENVSNGDESLSIEKSYSL